MQHLQGKSAQELIAIIEAQAKRDSSGLIVKITEKGGVFIKHESFKEYSTAKEKEYIAGINLGFTTAKALFNNPDMINQIRDFVNQHTIVEG